MTRDCSGALRIQLSTAPWGLRLRNYETMLVSSRKPINSVALGLQPVGAKRREGDRRTPEGRYRIDFRKAGSGYHRALHISYPSRDDRARAARDGASLGGAVMIHGLRNGFGWIGHAHRSFDWTHGCVALTNTELDELWRAVPDGTLIELRP